ncbi:MAG: serine/threonine-protein kinase [Acidobacteriota bacterium]
MIGRLVLDRFVIEEELGRGAMGTVYRGRHVELPRRVAIKVMHAEHVQEPVLLARFYREAKLAGRLSHPNVVQVIDVGEDAGCPVMVMELAEGQSLGELMAGDPFPRERIWELVRQLLRGLDHAHGCGLVHRDLKPDNVIVERASDGGDLARIVDFGIAVLCAPDEELQRLTGTGMIIGTPLYMAPEQAKAEAVDHRADLYALGIILYELLSGRQPFTGTAMEVAVDKIDHDPPPIDGLDPIATRYLGKLVARDPAARFATAKDALAMLDLMHSDPDAASLALGITDVARALATISLPR